jgi:hypothetical protein
MSEFAELIRAAQAGVMALRSYQYGNVAPDLAEEVATSLESAIEKALDARDEDLVGRLAEIDRQMQSLTLLMKRAAQLQVAQRAENLLAHCHDGHCTGSPDAIATMIATLESVLGRSQTVSPDPAPKA